MLSGKFKSRVIDNIYDSMYAYGHLSMRNAVCIWILSVCLSVCIISKCWLLGWLVGDHLLLRDFGPYGITFMFRIVFWDVLPCKIIVDRRFRGTCCLHHQGSHPYRNRSLLFVKHLAVRILARKYGMRRYYTYW
jgi:hypothetical protein